MTVLDLDVIIYPCPKGGPRYRETAKLLGGKHQFPYFMDPNTGVKMYESNDIVEYLFNTYGIGPIPFMLAPTLSSSILLSFAALIRPGKGAFYKNSIPPVQFLELYSYEGSPMCRPVRELLSELEIPYYLHNTAPGSKKISRLRACSGKASVPYLFDPNTQVSLSEPEQIMQYLKTTYHSV